MIQTYSSLADLQLKEKAALDPLMLEMEAALDALEPWLLKMFWHEIERPSLEGFGQIIYYFAEVELRHLQVFLQEPEDIGTKVWDYRGYTIEVEGPAERVDTAMKTYERTIINLLHYEFDELVKHYETTGNWLEVGEEHPILQNEFSKALILLIVPYFHRAYLKIPKKHRWKKCYLDFYPFEKELLEVYDVEEGTWVEIIRA